MYHVTTSLIPYQSDNVEMWMVQKSMGSKSTNDTKARSLWNFASHTHTLPELSEVMMDHNLMEILNKNCYTHSNLWYLMLRIVDGAEKLGTGECQTFCNIIVREKGVEYKCTQNCLNSCFLFEQTGVLPHVIVRDVLTIFWKNMWTSFHMIIKHASKSMWIAWY